MKRFIQRLALRTKERLKPASYVIAWWANPARARKRISHPTILNIPITDNCNSRCVMCSVWRTHSTNELTAHDLERLLSDDLYRHVEHVGISGGEPSLRHDLVQLVEAILSRLPALRTLSITSHGFHTARWKRYLPKIKEICDRTGTAFTLNLSFDGVGAVHDEIRGIPGAFDKLEETIKLARELNVSTVLQATILSHNVYHVGRMLRYAQSNNLNIIYRLATEITRLENSEEMGKVGLTEIEKSFFADFLTSRALLNATPSPARRLFYRDLAHRLATGDVRRAPCHFQREGLLISSHGELFHCSISSQSIGNALGTPSITLYYSRRSDNIRNELIHNRCKSCLHDQSGAWSPLQLAIEQIAESMYGRIITRLISGIGLLTRAPTLLMHAKRNSRKRKSRPQTSLADINTAVIIGAYGGEHVGDAAILGGVISRILADKPIKRIIIASIRPHRTTRWIKTLKLPVIPEVMPYHLSALKKLLSNEKFMLVYGGGPVMDLPILLAKHLDIANWTVSRGMPFVVEGVGIGPFKLRLSQWMAKSLLSIADRVSVRMTKPDARILRDIVYQTTYDPAFDYIKTRKSPEHLTPRERLTLEGILRHTEGRVLVGINLRPLWAKYAGNLSRESLRQAEDRLLHVLAQSMVDTTQARSEKYTFVFFPMNADQYGFSDLDIAYKLRETLPNDIDYRIWEIEPGVDAVLQFLRRMNIVISMRFHATIFALSQNVPTIAIDYMLGKPGKVSRLLEDMGMLEDLNRVDAVTSEWLSKRLAFHLERRR